MSFVVEKQNPRSLHPNRTDEYRECEDFPSLKAEWEDLTGCDAFEAHAEAGRLVRGEVDVLEHTDPETGIEVIARRT